MDYKNIPECRDILARIDVLESQIENYNNAIAFLKEEIEMQAAEGRSSNIQIHFGEYGMKVAPGLLFPIIEQTREDLILQINSLIRKLRPL